MSSLVSNYYLVKVKITVCDVDFAYLPDAALVAVIEQVDATDALIFAVPFGRFCTEQESAIGAVFFA